MIGMIRDSKSGEWNVYVDRYFVGIMVFYGCTSLCFMHGTQML